MRAQNAVFKFKFKFIIAISTVYKIQLIGICFGVLTCITQQHNNTTLQDRKPKRHINNKEYNTMHGSRGMTAVKYSTVVQKLQVR